MAQFRNVSGQDRHLALPDWYAPKFAEAGGVVDVDDSLIYAGPPQPQVDEDGNAIPIPADHHAGTYNFDQPGIWEAVSAPTRAESKSSNDDKGGK